MTSVVSGLWYNMADRIMGDAHVQFMYLPFILITKLGFVVMVAISSKNLSNVTEYC
jgi:hypothetical protein